MDTLTPSTTLASRLKQAMAEANLTQESLADRAGVSQNTIHKLISGKSQSSRKLVEIAAALNVSPAWLGAGYGPQSNQTPAARDGGPLILEPLHPWDDSTVLDDDEVELPLYKEVEIAAGKGLAVATAVRPVDGRKLRFSYATLRASGVDPSTAICAQITGNSQEPLIMDGSTIGIDTATTNVLDGELYALEHDGLLRVKFLYRLPGGGLRMRSYNREEHPDEEYTHDALASQQIRVLGWVFWWSTVRRRRGPALAR